MLHSVTSAWAFSPRSLQNVNVYSITTSCWIQKTNKICWTINPLIGDCWCTSPKYLPSKELHAHRLIRSRQCSFLLFFPNMHPSAPETHRTHTIIKTCHFICFMPLLPNLSQTSVDPIQVSQTISIPFQGCRESKWGNRNSTAHLGEIRSGAT